MSAKGYISSTDVSDFLSRTFSTAETTQCDVLIEQAETHIDNETRRAWLTGALEDDTYYVKSGRVFLKYVPVASVATVKGRSGLGSSDVTLVADSDYEVMDLGNGEIRLVSPANYDRLLISYTPVDTVPADIKRAAIEIVAAWLSPTLNPGSHGLDSLSLPDITVKYARSHVQDVVPPIARRILENYRFI